MKKTKKEKVLADLRRKIQRVEQQTMPLPEISENKFPVKEVKKDTYAFVPQNNNSSQDAKVEIDYGAIKKDLQKTLLLSAVIFSAITALKFIIK
jgi:hypothetical protein